MMRLGRRLAWMVLAALFLAALCAAYLAPLGYEDQMRDHTDEPPSAQFWLGTDELGRDRWARLLYGSQVSLALAPASALLSVLLAAAVGGVAGYRGGWIDRSMNAGIDLFLSLPWLFVLLSARALLPLNTSPWASVAVTFLLLGLLGWPAAARVVRVAMCSIRNSEYVLSARAQGIPELRLLWSVAMPNLRHILSAQFWLTVPMFLVAEASLGVLGLGVSEPLPSWGTLLRELEGAPFLADSPWLFAPAAILAVCLGCFQLVLTKEESTR